MLEKVLARSVFYDVLGKFMVTVHGCTRYIKFKGLRLTAGRRHTRVCVGLGRVHVQLSGAYRALGGGKVENCSVLETGAGLAHQHLGPRLGQVEPVWSMLGTSWDHVEPGLCWPRLGLCWA